MNERDIQFAIYRHRRSIQPWPLILTNIYFFGWESDALYVTNAGLLYEYEIKTSRSDFFADMNKIKHRFFVGGKTILGTDHTLPTEFSYVVPDGLVTVDEVPEYAGLYYVMPAGGHNGRLYRECVQCKKRPPRRKGIQLQEKHWRSLATKATDRFWTLREAQYEISTTGSAR